MEILRTFLISANAPLKFQGDVVLTVGFLINTMSSSAIKDKVPHSVLFPDEPLFCIPPWVFGSICYVYDLTPVLDKLSTCAIKYVFLGH